MEKHLTIKEICENKLKVNVVSERLKTEINVGEKYMNREDVLMTVLVKVTDNDYHVINENGIYDFQEYGNGYIVTKFGGFGVNPNQRDLIKKILI